MIGIDVVWCKKADWSKQRTAVLRDYDLERRFELNESKRRPDMCRPNRFVRSVKVLTNNGQIPKSKGDLVGIDSIHIFCEDPYAILEHDSRAGTQSVENWNKGTEYH